MSNLPTFVFLNDITRPCLDFRHAYDGPEDLEKPIRYLLSPETEQTLVERMEQAAAAYNDDLQAKGKDCLNKLTGFRAGYEACAAIASSESTALQQRVERMRLALEAAKEMLHDVVPSDYPGQEQKEYTIRAIAAALNNKP